MTKYISLGMLTFFLWCLATLLQNKVTELSAIGEVAEAGQLIVPMWGFTIACGISLITLALVTLFDSRWLDN
jgi:hypothetical protein